MPETVQSYVSSVECFWILQLCEWIKPNFTIKIVIMPCQTLVYARILRCFFSLRISLKHQQTGLITCVHSISTNRFSYIKYRHVRRSYCNFFDHSKFRWWIDCKAWIMVSKNEVSLIKLNFTNEFEFAEMQHCVSFVWVKFRPKIWHNKLINDILYQKSTTLSCKENYRFVTAIASLSIFLLMKSVGSNFGQFIYENLKTKTNKIYEFRCS